MPMVEEADPNVTRVDEDLIVKALFVEANILQTTGGGSSSPQIDRQGRISDPSHALDFFTLPIDIRRQLIKEYRQRTNAQPFVPPVAEIR